MTVDPKQFAADLAEAGVDFYAGVPDSLLKDFCAYVADRARPGGHVIAVNEGSALAIATGYHLGTGRCPLVYLQNSGLGNLVNPLLSLADAEVYGIPMVILVGWRGEPGTRDEPQHMKQGRVSIPMLEAMEQPYRVLGAEDDAAAADVAWAVETAEATSSPVFLLVPKGVFAPYALAGGARPEPALTREVALEALLAEIGTGAVTVATTGMIGREVAALREALGEDPGIDFLNVGAMGHATSIALGVALARPDERVVCLDGDGAMLMHLGAVAVAGTAALPSFVHVVLNNGAHDSVGGQPTVGFDVDLGAIARACGYQVLPVAEDVEGIRRAGDALRTGPGPLLLEIRVARGARPDLGRPKAAPADSKQQFMGHLDARSRGRAS